MKRKLTTYIKWLLPVLFIVYFIDISLFTHVHVENGVTIVHSHPFKTSPDGSSHHHATLAEIQLFHILSTFQTADGAVQTIDIEAPHSLYFILLGSSLDNIYQSALEGTYSLRAPPTVS